MHLPPAVMALSAIMMLPVVQVTLSHADSVRILMAVFAAAGSIPGGVSVVGVDDAATSAPISGAAIRETGSRQHRKCTELLNRNWFIRLKSTAFLSIALILVLLCGVLLSVGVAWGGRLVSQDSAVKTNTDIQNPSTVVDQPVIHLPAAPVIVSGTCGKGASFVLTEDGVLTISGQNGVVGVMQSWDYQALMNGAEQSIFRDIALIPYKEQVISLVVEEGIAEIGYAAFSQMPNLETVSLPESCTVIREGAFFQCEKLLALVFPSGVIDIADSVLHNCASLQRVVVPEMAERIGTEAFAGCESLSEVVFPGTHLREIFSNAFADTQSLTQIALPSSLTHIGEYAFRSAGFVSMNMSHIQNVTIEKMAFTNCQNLQEVILPKTLQHIPDYMFSMCGALTTVEMGDKLQSIGSHAFSRTGLQTLTIPASVISIDANAFLLAKNLSAILVADDNPMYRDVDGVLFNRQKDRLICYPSARTASTYIAPETVRHISKYAFYGSQHLTSLIFPNEITILESYAIYQMEKLRDLYFYGDVPLIWGDDAIAQCESVVIHYPANADGYTAGAWTAPDGNVYRTQKNK